QPKERSKRSTSHNSSVKLPSAKRKSLDEETIVEDSGFSVNAVSRPSKHLIEEHVPAAPVLKKKDKQQLKREAFLERIELRQSPYSKSHERRMKRKNREQIGQGLGDIRDALQDSEKSKSLHMQVDGDNASKSSTQHSKVRSNQIGEGKGSTLSEKQRKKALKTELLRQRLILSNPEFSSNPFQTIRTHAQNTLVKH
ncbi:hypothetical protein BT96DRAFT_799186, partial [Gymnopus androsaceus JB14]